MEFLSIRKEETREDDEESLSLVDLPINSSPHKPKTEKSKPSAEDFNFDLCLHNCSVPNESEMCAADDVFFQGQMLPYRHSVSSKTGNSLFLNGHIARSESVDHRLTRGVMISSRSSSINSQYSSSSGSATGSINRSRNYFHSHPSPSPKIKTLNPYRNTSNISRKSNFWDFFRVGLVKTPEMELCDIRNRSQNSTSSSNSINKNKGSKNEDEKLKSIEKKKKNIFSDLSGCKCSVNVINPVNFEERERDVKKVERQRKSTSSRSRTFEWINKLSVECAPEEHRVI